MASALHPEASKVLLVRQLPYKATTDDLYELFGKYGAIRQIRLGDTPETRGRAFVIYHDVYDAQKVVDHLNGYSMSGRYLVITFYKLKEENMLESSNNK